MMLPALLPRKPSVALLAASLLSGACASSLSQRPSDLGPRPAAEEPSAAPTHDYWVYVGAESADLIHRVRFGPGSTFKPFAWALAHEQGGTQRHGQHGRPRPHLPR